LSYFVLSNNNATTNNGFGLWTPLSAVIPNCENHVISMTSPFTRISRPVFAKEYETVNERK
jgi:hypothetical protein